MSSYSSSLVFRKIVSDWVWQQLVELWLSMAYQDETQLFTENTLHKLIENECHSNISEQLKAEKLFLLITPKFSALLHRSKIITAETYQVSAIFDPGAIIDELLQLGKRLKWNLIIIKYLRTNLIAKLTKDKDSFSELLKKVVKLLDNSNHQQRLYSASGMEKLVQHQAEQERIFEQIQIQTSQNLNLSEIIQTAVDRSCSFLGTDRLLIYQLDVPLDLNHHSFKPVPTVNTITYEARTSDEVASTLYFQDEICWQESQKSRNKYRQGFSLVIDDVESGSNLNDCLKTVMAKFQVKAKVVTPINVHDKLWGLIIAHQCEPKQWHHREVQFLHQIAEYLAIAIFNHQSYQQLRQQKQLLEKQVQIQAQQLKDALIAAEAASKSKHDFLGSMSHELRTPLTCVIGLSSTLLQWSSAKHQIPLSPEKQQEYLHLIQQSGRDLLTLIDNILEYSDVESGKHLLNIQQISLSGVVKQSLSLLKEAAEEKKIVLDCEVRVEPERDCFLADEIRLKEILFHLLNNAVKFTPEGGRVVLRVWREKRQVAFQIEDTGIGIAASQMPSLFEKFSQVENLLQRTHGGAGLGLALTKKLVELHGGNIEVESAFGEGSMFTVYLPETNSSESNSTKAITVPLATSDSKTLVLITEDETSATFICQLLNTSEYQVVWLTNSAVALNQIELLQPEIIIIDRDCSVTEVKNVMSAIARIAPANNPRVALLCDRFEREEWQKFTDCGVNGYLLKSMNPAQITSKLESLMNQKLGNELQTGYEEMG